jgi:hypothetical protein
MRYGWPSKTTGFSCLCFNASEVQICSMFPYPRFRRMSTVTIYLHKMYAQKKSTNSLDAHCCMSTQPELQRFSPLIVCTSTCSCSPCTCLPSRMAPSPFPLPFIALTAAVPSTSAINRQCPHGRVSVNVFSFALDPRYVHSHISESCFDGV